MQGHTVLERQVQVLGEVTPGRRLRSPGKCVRKGTREEVFRGPESSIHWGLGWHEGYGEK